MKKMIDIPRRVLLISVFVFSGCAAPGLYSVSMYYDAEKAAIPGHLQADSKDSGAVISIAEFIDERQMDDQLVIGRVVEDNGTKVLVFPKNIKATKAVSYGIKEYLRKAGYKVSNKIEPWDLKEGTIPMGDNKLLIGGNIEELEVSCRKNFPSSSYKSNIKLNIVFADITKGRILYKTAVESSYSREHLLFSEEVLGDQVSIALGDAIEKLFDDKAVAQKLKEAMAQ